MPLGTIMPDWEGSIVLEPVISFWACDLISTKAVLIDWDSSSGIS